MPVNSAKKSMVQVKQGRLNFTTMSGISEGAAVLTGTPIKILFDSGATHSFICGKLVGRLGLIGSHTKLAYMIVTPGGKISSHTLTYKVPLQLGSKTSQTNLIV
jgi:hypothetical protein